MNFPGYIFGAVCPREGKGAALVLPFCNTAGMSLHLAEIARMVEPGRHAVLLLDQAGWHLSADLKLPANITVLPLPAKCPELNVMENVWQFMRDNWLSNNVNAGRIPGQCGGVKAGHSFATEFLAARPPIGGLAARRRQPSRSGLYDFAGLWSGGGGLVLLRPGGRAAASGGLLEAVAVAVHRQDADVVGEPVQQRAGQPL